MSYLRWRPYVPVARRRANAIREMQKLRKEGMSIEPVEIEGRKIANTFWGQAWCKHLEQFSDYANRLPRGRTYVRHGAVCHLAISTGKIQAIVSGSELYNIDIGITPLSSPKWKSLRGRCAGQIGSILELLQGRFSKSVMEIVMDRSEGLFPVPKEIQLSCDCPDWAVMCKHVAAVLYAIGARLDQKPELLFVLRNVDHEELISAELDVQATTAGKGKRRRLAGEDLSDVFGVEIEDIPRKRDGRSGNATRPSQKTAGTMAARTMSETMAVARKKAAADARARSVTWRNPTPTASGKEMTAARPVPAPREKAFSPTTSAVAALRRRFEMNRSQFATLLGVSPPAVAYWENKSGPLKLRQQTVEALQQAARLSKDQAWARLSGLGTGEVCKA
jgi:uncharacterized Zn finger protein